MPEPPAQTSRARNPSGGSDGGSDEQGGELPRLQRHPMPRHRARPALAVAEILAKQRPRLRARIIVDGEIGLDPDPPSPLAQAVVELGILIMGEGLAIAANGEEGVEPHQRMMAMIDEAAGGAHAVKGAARAEQGILRRRGCSLEAADAPRAHRDGDRYRPCPLRRGDQAANETSRVTAMGIGTDQPFPTHPMDLRGEVERRALDALGVVEQADVGIGGCALLDDGAAPIGAAAIRNDDQRAGRITRQIGEEAGKMLLLVQAGNDDQRFSILHY
jgi:hypothetical protein